MKAKLCLLFSILILSGPAFPHSGKTDSNGGHNCSEKSKKKGLCSGYHYHGNSMASTDLESAKHQHAKAETKVDSTQAKSPVSIP